MNILLYVGFLILLQFFPTSTRGVTVHKLIPQIAHLGTVVQL